MFGLKRRAFIARHRAKLGTGEQAVSYAVTIDDHFDRLEFLKAWLHGDVGVLSEFPEYEMHKEHERA